MSDRGSWCTPAWLAEILPTFDLDPCSNERSNVRAHKHLMLERGDDGMGWGQPKAPGSYVDGPHYSVTLRQAPAAASVFVNPPYDNTAAWVAHWKRQPFMFLLRWDPSTAWFEELIRETSYVWFPKRRRINFEPPPGVKGVSNPYPHAIYANGILETQGMIDHGYRLLT